MNPLYFIFNKVNGYFEDINGNTYLTLFPNNESKENSKKYKDLWIKIRDLIKSITKNSDDNNENFMKIEFNSDDKLTLNKMIEIPTMTIVVRAVFHENDKYYQKLF